MILIEKGKPIWLVLLLLVVGSNLALYQTAFGTSILPEEAQYVVLGSLFDLILVAPILWMLYRKQFSWKMAIALIAFGCIGIRFIIPSDLLAPFSTITLAGIGMEVLLVLFELLLIVTLLRYFPKIIQDVKQNDLPVLHTFNTAVEKYVKNNILIQMICSELLMAYYALASWKKPIPNGITLYKNSSYIAFQVMMIHAIIVETLGLHYFLHAKWPVVSFVLLLLNVYSVVFFLADIQAVRMNPVQIQEGKLYISLGLMKRMAMDLQNVECIIEEKAVLEQKCTKDTLEFVARDFEKVYPDFILKMKQSQKATLFLGKEKHYNYIAIKSDDPVRLKQMIALGMGRDTVD
ncbi:MAG: beta-carotene 15,15'-monooxygenase [Solibacillus sp.]